MRMPQSFRFGRAQATVQAHAVAQSGDEVSQVPPATESSAPARDAAFDGSVYTAGDSVLARAREVLGLKKKGLSQQAQAKLLKIKQDAANARGAMASARNTIEDLRESLAVLDRDIQGQQEHLDRLPGGTKEPVVLSKAKEDAAIIRNEIARQQKAMAQNHEVQTQGQALSDVLFNYVARISDQARVFTGAVEPRMLDGESAGDAVNRLRRRRRELESDLQFVRHAPWPSSEAKEMARSQVDALVERGRPNVFDVLDSRGDIGWPTVTSQVMSRAVVAGQEPQLIITTTSDTLAIMAWLNRDAMVAQLNAEIDSCSDDTKALTGDERKAKSVEILSDMLASEREEEVLIESMEAAGGTFLRRRDADPRAVLGLSSEMPAPDVTHL